MEKNIEYLKIQENLRSENLTVYHLCKNEFFDLFFSSPKHIPQEIIEFNENLCLFVKKAFQRKVFFKGNAKFIIASLKFFSNLYSQFEKLCKSALWFCFKIEFLKIFSTIFAFLHIHKTSLYTYSAQSSFKDTHGTLAHSGTRRELAHLDTRRVI